MNETFNERYRCLEVSGVHSPVNSESKSLFLNQSAPRLIILRDFFNISFSIVNY